MERLIVAIVLLFLISLSATYILHHFFKNKRFIKYLPAMISLIATIINIILAVMVRGDGFQDLGYFVMAMFTAAMFISGLAGALFFDYITPKLKKK